MEAQALVCFTTAGRRLALPLSAVRRVVAAPLLEAPLGAPGFIEGFFDYGGIAAAAIRLDRLLGLEEEPLGLYAPLLLLRDADPPIAVHVERVDGVVRAADAEVRPIGREETFNACVVGRIAREGETVYVLSAADILIAEEKAAIAAHRAEAGRRLNALAGDAGDAARAR